MTTYENMLKTYCLKISRRSKTKAQLAVYDRLIELVFPPERLPF